ncbi:hypothetical protein [Aquimarina algiphila]|uniref:hypothetical protein n=1 Tax=Aquimarina algiphila TaxID=2047982 RepID=UPI00232EA814|nr:hypothetical protein [Aquimarina algiphila]
MKNRKQKSCLEKYTNKKADYFSKIEGFDDSELMAVNDKIKKHLYQTLNLIDAMKVDSGATDTLSAFFTQLKELLIGKKPIQALVFYFNRDGGELFLSAYGTLKPDSFIDKELSLSNRLDNEVVGEIGPIKIFNYNEIKEDALYYDEIDDCDLEYENDYINELIILKAYAIFEEIFLKLDLKNILSDIQITSPFYSYIQEHDGGESNLLTIFEK